MSKKEVDEAQTQTRYTTTKKPEVKRPKPTYIDGIKVNKPTEEDSPVDFYYKMDLNLTEDPLHSFCMKRKYPSGKVEHFIKYARSGPATGRMLNPWGIYYSAGDEHKYDKTLGRSMYELMKVTEDAFSYYMHFLKTRNEQHLRYAEREGQGI